MNTDLIFKIFIYGCAVFLSIFQGNAAVYLFNRMPAEWLCDYDEDPSEELIAGMCRGLRACRGSIFSVCYLLS